MAIIIVVIIIIIIIIMIIIILIIIINMVVATVGGAGRGRPALTISARHKKKKKKKIPAGALPLDPRSLALRFIGFTHSACHYYSQLFSTTQIGLATTLIIIINGDIQS